MATATGTVALENCNVTPICQLSCNGPCNSNSWLAAWPHWTRCYGVVCPNQTRLPVPYNNHCAGQIWFQSCAHHSVWLTAHLSECGPWAATKHALACVGSASANVIACVNSALFRSICGGCRPSSKYVLKTTVSV
jgi:hypothetical protein